MPAQSNEVEPVYSEALAKADEAQRAAYLESACAGNPGLRARVEALLKAHHRADKFLETPPPFVDAPVLDESLTEGPGTVIGRYKLLEKIGEGGMAVVYMAEQAEPIRRKVALKIIKLGMDTRQVIARFEAERQALALMDHPSIAKVLDAGATETGRPYFVMELVQGVSITEYCDKNNLSTKDRLALFLQVCQAVQHAHQKGIIHRDIKPSNVMVTHQDGKPVPKVIDFGIAKATNQRLTEKTLFTRYAHIIGTPAYMSPEQAELSDLDIDTRTDIYSLGVLLYELLTGTTPFSEEDLRKAGYIEMQRIIREQEPLKPSTKIRTTYVAQPPSAGKSHVGQPPSAGGPRRHSRGRLCYPRSTYEQVRGDLDWIVMKSLEKDRARRYETTSALASDILRHLEHEPVLARGPSTTYRLQKLLRRHRSRIIIGLAMALVAGGSVVILSLWNRDRLQLLEAEGFKHRNILSQAQEQYARGDRQAALETITPVLHSKHVGPEAQFLQASILVDNRRSEEAAIMLRNLLNDRPEVAGVAHSLLARILWESESPNAEKLKEIQEHRRKAEVLLPETAEAYFLRAMTAVTIKEQLASLDRALQLDPSHYESRRLRAFTFYASRKYDQLRDDAMAMTILRPRDPLGYSLRAIAFRELGKYQEATAEYDRAIALASKDSPAYVDLSVQRSETLLRMGAYDRVIAEAPVDTQDLTGVAGILPAIRGRDALDTQGSASLQYHVFCALTALGNYERASVLFREIISPGQEARRKFQDWCMKYVFDTLEAGRSWHPVDREPAGAALLPMIEAEETYRGLSAKGHRVTTDGFGGSWSPDGKRLAFSLGVRGRSGVAVLDPATQETDLLIVPGRDPRWSPNGQYIAFVRDRQNLRLEELATAAEGEGPSRPVADEEVWLMNSDGMQPRRLARGGWPSWSEDSIEIYYHSRVDNTLCSISIAGRNAEPKRIMTCRDVYPLVAPDSHRVAYLEGGHAKVTDLDSRALVAEWPVPSPAPSVSGWSPTGRELCAGGRNNSDDTTGLWVYSLDASEPARVLGGQITLASWSPDGTKLVFTLASPYFEMWAAELDPAIPTSQALGPTQTLDEHFREMVALYTGRIEADPADANNYLQRAQQYHYLHEEAKVRADMSRYTAILSRGSSSDLRIGTQYDFRHVIDAPFGYQLVFSVGRRDGGTQVLCVAFGQKGRCEMRVFEIPMLAMSLFGLGLLSGLDAPAAHADFTFSEPTNLGPLINSPNGDAAPEFSADGLSLFFDSDRSGQWEIWVTTRATKDDPWGPPVNLGLGEGGGPSLSTDGLSLFFHSSRPGGSGATDLWVTKRTTTSDPWGVPENLGSAVNGVAYDYHPEISADGLTLYFQSNRSGGLGDCDIWMTTRATKQGPWAQPVNLGPTINSPDWQAGPDLSADGRVLFFASGDDVVMTTRATASDGWGIPIKLSLARPSSAWDAHPCISGDGSILAFCAERPNGLGGIDLWQSDVIPVVDFNGDGKIDGKEVMAMAEHWGQNKSLYDIGLPPMGNGVVDVNDLTVLAGYIGQEVNDPTLIAHWALDETEDTTAYDNVGENDAMVIGGAVWQTDGKIGGALGFDGKDDFARSGKSVLDPAAGPFSVIAWVKGGAPNRVIVSQASGADWLYLNQYGMLTTDLKASGTNGKSLTSSAFALDDQWHRVALVWDGTNRALHMDGVEVAKDTQPSLAASSGSLHIGAGKYVTPAAFWSGLIDDVRIYNRVVQP